MDQAFVLSMLEMVINGVSTRKVTHVVEQLCGENISKSFVSNLTEKLDPIVKAWAQRPLNTKYYPYIFADAMYIKVREYQRVVSKAVYIIAGFTEDHRREIFTRNPITKTRHFGCSPRPSKSDSTSIYWHKLATMQRAL